MNMMLITKGCMIFGPLLAIASTVWKLTDVIDWPWVWVLSPLWLPLAFAGVLFIILSFLANKRMLD